MRNMRRISTGCGLAFLLPAMAPGATVHLDIVPLVNNEPVTTANPVVTVEPEGIVHYEVTGTVVPSDGGTTPDSDGLG